MKLKTYRAASMAQALSEVKKDLGKDAVILHTRTYRTGAVLGLGGKQVVEITASDQPPRSGGSRVRSTRAAAPDDFTPATFQNASPTTLDAEPGTTADSDPRAPTESADTPAQTLAPTATRTRPSAGVSVSPPALARPAAAIEAKPDRVPRADAEPPAARLASTRVDLRPADASAVEQLQQELGAIKSLVGQVLRCARQSPSFGANSLGGGVLSLGGLPEPLMEEYLLLQRIGVDVDLAEAIASAVRQELRSDELSDAGIVRHTLLRALADRLSCVPPDKAERRPDGRPLTLALVGPTGVGKTTTIAKLAAGYKLRQGKRVGLVTCDTYRIAAVDQLRTYASIIGLPLKVASGPEQAASALSELADMDVILVDTAGRSPHDAQRLNELSAILQAVQPHHAALVLSAAASEKVMARAARRFALVSPDRLILSKLDEAVALGHLLNFLRECPLPISHVTTGQEVPDEIEAADPHRLARRMLDPVSVESSPSMM